MLSVLKSSFPFYTVALVTCNCCLHLLLCMCFLFFIFFQFQVTFSIILYWFHMYSVVVRPLYSLHIVPPDTSNNQLTSHMVITLLLLTISPMLFFTSHDCLSPFQSGVL